MDDRRKRIWSINLDALVSIEIDIARPVLNTDERYARE